MNLHKLFFYYDATLIGYTLEFLWVKLNYCLFVLTARSNEHSSIFRGLVNTICDRPDPTHPDVPPEQRVETFDQRLSSVREKPLWRNILNINAVIIISVLCFLYGFFHWFYILT